MDVPMTIDTRRGAAAERFFRAAVATEHQTTDAPFIERRNGLYCDADDDDDSDDHEDECRRSPAISQTDALRHADEGDEGAEIAGFTPSNAIEQVLYDPYLLLEIFNHLYASFSAPVAPSMNGKSTLDHLRPTYRRLRNVQQVCVLWRAVARLVVSPTDYLHTKPSCYMLTERYSDDMDTFLSSSLLSLSVLPLPALPWPTADAPPPVPTADQSASSSNGAPPPSASPPLRSSTSSSSSSEPAIKLYLVSGYSEGEVKIWDVDQRGPNGSHCVKTLQYTTSRWFTRHFRSMALASLVDVPTPTYPLGQVETEVRKTSKTQNGSGSGGLISRLGSSSPFSLGRSSQSVKTSPSRQNSMTLSASAVKLTRDSGPDSLMMQHSVDGIPTTKQRKKSWLAKKWERKSGKQQDAQQGQPESPRRTSPRQLSPRQHANNWGFTSAPVSVQRDRFALFQERIETSEGSPNSPAEEAEQEVEQQTDDGKKSEEEHLDFVLIDAPEPEERREHLASVFYHLILVWDIIKGEVLRVLDGHTLEVNVLQPLKGGLQLASGSEDKSIRIWDVRTGQCLRVLQRIVSVMRSPVLSLAKLPNGHLVAGAENNKITVWDVDTGKRVGTIKGATEPVWHFQILNDNVGFFPDSSDDSNIVRLISSTGHWDPTKRTNKGQVTVWDVKNVRKIRTIFEHDGYARNMIGLPGGYLAVAFHYYGSVNNSARLLILDLNSLSSTSTDDTGDSSGFYELSSPRMHVESAEAAEESPPSQREPSQGADQEWSITGEGGVDGGLRTKVRSSSRAGDLQASNTTEDEVLPESDDEVEEGRPRRQDDETTGDAGVNRHEEGDGRTWRLVPGTKDLKVNAMVVMPDGRLIGASSDGSIRVWDFRTKSR